MIKSAKLNVKWVLAKITELEYSLVWIFGLRVLALSAEEREIFRKVTALLWVNQSQVAAVLVALMSHALGVRPNVDRIAANEGKDDARKD